MKPIKFNINSYVRVRLTDYGRALHRKKHDELNERLAARGYKPFVSYSPPKEEDGWSKWQMWHLMETFGRHVGLGVSSPFETEIEILKDRPYAKRKR